MPPMVGKTTLQVPHEPGAWITIRELGGLELDDAMEARGNDIIKRLGAIDAETMKNYRAQMDSLRSSDAEEAPSQAEQLERARNPMSYDWPTLFTLSIVDWSWDVEVNDMTRVKLDKTTNEWLVREIINYNVRSQADLSISAGS